jgi:hypothetical protein
MVILETIGGEYSITVLKIPEYSYQKEINGWDGH